MHINSIKASGFRNLSQLEFKPNPGLNIFVGQNGQGKTNLLETIYVASKGRSFRPGRMQEWRNQNLSQKEAARVELELMAPTGSKQIQMFWTGQEKKFLLNGQKITTGKMTQLLPTILFSPESLMAIKEGPEKRRSLIDEMLSARFETQHVYSQYKKALSNRNSFLKECREKSTYDETLYRSLNILSLNFSTQLTLARIEYFIQLESFIKKALTLIFENELAYRFDYVISDHNVKDWDHPQILALHQKRAQELKSVELRLGSSLVGAHKHDIKFYLNEKDSRYFGSQGQQRGLILAIKMAEVLYRCGKGEQPVLLLDDVLSELDHKKREKLLDFLKQFKTQIFITTTEEIGKEKLQGHFYNIQRGNIILDQQIDQQI